MKKLPLILSSIALVCMLGLSAQAVTLSNANRGVTAPVDAQARMLQQLGLFLGTEEGFELERAMTRDEAAAMLVRYLGAETKARTGTWKHPFTDVAPWAQQYVGWLYQNGMTKGVSASQFGAAQKVTAEQFCVFLARALTGKDLYTYGLAQEDEIKACDKAGFTRGDAVVLSARALTEYYTKGEEAGLKLPMAEYLIEKGVFTRQKFGEAAWAIFGCDYTDAPASSGSDAARTPSWVVGDVTVQHSGLDAHALSFRYSGYLHTQLYAYQQDGDTYILYALDRQTLEATEVWRTNTAGKYLTVSVLGSGFYAEGDDLLLAFDERAGKTGELLACDGKTVRVMETLPMDYKNFASDYNSIIIQCKNGLFNIGADGAKLIETSENERMFAFMKGWILTQEVTAEQTTIRCRRHNNPVGDITDEYTVKNDYPTADVAARAHFAPTLFRLNDVYAWGEAGMYMLKDGRLQQVTARAALDYSYDASTGAIVVASHTPGARIWLLNDSVQLGNEILSVAPNGKETVLLSNTPAHELAIGEIISANRGVVEFTAFALEGNHNVYSNSYRLQNGKIQVLRMNPIFHGENGVQDEQQRLDALGVGINS